MHILLVNPKPIEAYTVYGPCLGLCYLSAYLKDKGIKNIEGIDLNIDSASDLAAAISRADIVGIYCSTKAMKRSLEIAFLAKQSNKIVVLGGPHPSVLPEEVLSDANVDFVILSEGEESFCALIKAVEGDNNYSMIDGIGYKNDGDIVINPRTKFIKDLDTIPFPDRNLFKFDYSSMVTVCATRGCPYKCANCQPALSLQTCAFRMRSVENLIAELKQVAVGKVVHFVDNDLTVNKKWMKRFCESIIEEKIKIKWACQGRVNTLDKDLMCLMKKAGCVGISLGIESGSQELLDGFLRKQLSLERAKQVVRESVEAKMPLHGWFIIGIPTETKEDMEKTITFALTYNFASVGFSIGTPWPGTTFYKIASDSKWILTDNWEEFNEKRYSLLRTDHWEPKDVENYRREIIAKFRSKGWVVNENDFIFDNPFWGKNMAAKIVKMATIKYPWISKLLYR